MARKPSSPANPASSRAEMRAAAKEALYADLDKHTGKGAGRPLSEKPVEPVERLSTGGIGLDWALGGGLPLGRVIEAFGTESGGKSLMSLLMMGAVQRQGGAVAYVDAEYSFDAEWARKQGVDTEAMYYHTPTSGENALSAVEGYARSGAVDLVVVDSVAALVPLAELQGEMGAAHVGQMARMMGQHLRRVTEPASRSKCTIIFINQIREKIGIMFGNPETTPGGRALKFYSSIRLDVRRGEAVKAGEEVIGYNTKIKVVKNKTAAPFRKLELPLMIGRGFDTVREAVNLAVTAGLITKEGQSFVYQGEKMGRGMEQAVEWMREREAQILPVLRPQLTTFLETGVV